MANRPKKIGLTKQDGESLIYATGQDLFEVPLDKWRAIVKHRREQTIGVMGSANFNSLRVLNNIPNAVAGFDQLVAENNPKPGETEGNAYHWVMAHTNHPTHPYLWCGPFPGELRTGHWFEFDDLKVYYLDGLE